MICIKFVAQQQKSNRVDVNGNVREVKRSSLLTAYSSCTSGKCEWERRLSIRFFHNPIVSKARGNSSEEGD